MKKIIEVLIIMAMAVTLVACGEKKDERTMEDFIAAFEANGIEVNLNENKPLYQMVGADDGILFFVDDNVVRIYQYDKLKYLKEAQKTYESTVHDMPVNGNFMLDTSYEEAITIFNAIE